MFFELTNIQPSLKAGRNYLNNIITGSEIFEKYPNDLKKVFVWLEKLNKNQTNKVSIYKNTVLI
jgi:hypothetical protein